MFTGIIEEVGTIEGILENNGFTELAIKCSYVLENSKIGDSIAVNGVCLTVKEMGKSYFKADVMGETIDKSTLGSLRINSRVNLERALRLCDRLGGHMVSGHIDGIGKIIDREEKSDGTWFTITSRREVMKYIIYKGSICIDGISLTVADVDKDMFKVSIIPHTLANTILKDKDINADVNLECDLLGRYIENFICRDADDKKDKSNITMEFLMNNGF